jgi:hypothetical protein
MAVFQQGAALPDHCSFHLSCCNFANMLEELFRRMSCKTFLLGPPPAAVVPELLPQNLL